MKRTNSPFIIEGKAVYIPKLNEYDKFSRHSVTIIPDDQSIIEELNDKRDSLLDYRETKHDIPADATPTKPSWKIIPNNNAYGLTINWTDKDIVQKEVAICNEDDSIFEGKYTDQQLMGATFKCSFELWSYCFNAKDSGDLVYGTKIKLRKLKVLSLATIADVFEHDNHHESIGGDANQDF